MPTLYSEFCLELGKSAFFDQATARPILVVVFFPRFSLIHSHFALQNAKKGGRTLLTFSLLISEDFWHIPDFPAIAVFSAHLVEGIKNTAIAVKRKDNPEILTN